jgi:hypothetical protein
MHNHHTVYVMNKYTESVDIFDSRRYSGPDAAVTMKRSEHHEDRVEIVSFHSLLCSIFFLCFATRSLNSFLYSEYMSYLNTDFEDGFID